MNTLITKERIYELARSNAVIHKAIMAHEHGGLDWPSALALMVWHLVEANNSRTELLRKHLELCSLPMEKLK